MTRPAWAGATFRTRAGRTLDADGLAAAARPLVSTMTLAGIVRTLGVVREDRDPVAIARILEAAGLEWVRIPGRRPDGSRAPMGDKKFWAKPNPAILVEEERRRLAATILEKRPSGRAWPRYKRGLL